MARRPLARFLRRGATAPDASGARAACDLAAPRASSRDSRAPEVGTSSRPFASWPRDGDVEVERHVVAHRGVFLRSLGRSAGLARLEEVEIVKSPLGDSPCLPIAAWASQWTGLFGVM